MDRGVDVMVVVVVVIVVLELVISSRYVYDSVDGWMLDGWMLEEGYVVDCLSVDFDR